MINVVITANNVTEVDSEAVKMLKNEGFHVKEYPDARLYSKEKFIEIVKDADAVIVGAESYTKEIIENMPNLKLIARRGVGIDNIDQEIVKTRKIKVTRTVGYVEDAVAELIMAFILDSARKVSLYNKEMHQGIWSYHLGNGLNNKVLGIVGFGAIGQATAVRANAFGMKVLCYNRHRNLELEKKYQAEYVDFDTLVKQSDYISISVPLTDESRNMFHKQVFEKMKENAVLINTARGAVVNADDLAEALREKRIGGACVDVYKNEPCEDSPLRSLENVLLTPHIGTFTKETFIGMNNHCAREIIHYFKNK